MHARSVRDSLVLQAGQIKSFVLTKPMQVRIVRGRVWLTISGRPDDYWMADDECMDLPTHRQVVIEAHKMDSVLGFFKIERNLHCLLAPKTAVYTES